MSKSDLAYRKDQVPNEGITPVGETPYSASRLVIHDHSADKAGRHLDIRFDIGNKAVSFATRKGLPTVVGKPTLLFRQPDHVLSYMDWEGNIPKGEYGAGNVSKAFDSPIVLKAGPDHIHFTITDGDNKGTYVLMKQNEKEWLAIKKKELERSWSERPSYKEEDVDGTDDDYVTTEKLDGAHFLAQINPSGVSYTSQRKNVNGDLLAREDKVPHLRDLKFDKDTHGMVLRGELWHDKGFNYTSGILNSAPTKAVEKQKQIGLMRFAPFRIDKGPNGEENLPYEDQYKIIQQIAKDQPYFFEPPKRAEGSADAFFKDIGIKKGEGIVRIHKETGQAYKKKHRYDYDLIVVEVIPGTGKYSDAMGALLLKDKTGRIVGKVGTGFTDEQRRSIMRNANRYIGSLVKVSSRPPLAGQLREPSFLGMTTDKNEADEVPR